MILSSTAPRTRWVKMPSGGAWYIGLKSPRAHDANEILLSFRASDRTASQFERDLYENTRYWAESYGVDSLYHARAVLSRMIQVYA